jgi:hypothetical protein
MGEACRPDENERFALVRQQRRDRPADPEKVGTGFRKRSRTNKVRADDDSENLTNNALRSSTASSEHKPVGDPA